MSKRYHFEGVTLLITHYNRSLSLYKLLSAFEALQCTFEDIVISDDGSEPAHQERIRSWENQFTFRLICAPKNKGLGNNINKGQEAVRSAFTLYVQEDFIPSDEFPERLTQALQLMREDEQLDIVRFYAYFKYPFLRPIRNGFSEMVFKWQYPGYWKFYQYSDHPHLRRSKFFEKFGKYIEGKKGDVTEYEMMMNFLKKKGKGLFYEDFQTLFEQKNSSDEPSTMKRNMWRESEHPLIAVARHAYRYIKFYTDYLFR